MGQKGGHHSRSKILTEIVASYMISMRSKTVQKASIAVAAVMLFSLTETAKAEMSAERFLEVWDKESREAKVYFLGNTNGISWMNTVVNEVTGKHYYCPPEKIRLKVEQEIDILRHYLETNPESSKLPLGMVIVDAFHDTFPCK